MSKATDIPQRIRQEVEERSGGYCEARIPGVCKSVASHLHHRLRRSQGGKHTAENLIHLCTNCHNRTHGAPAFGFATGLLLHAYDDAAIPVEEVRYRVREAFSDQRDSAKNRGG